MLVALIAPFQYRPEPLYRRTLHESRTDERYKDDAYARQVRAGQGWRARVIWELALMLTSCPAIPLSRKALLPWVIGRFAINQWQKKKDPAKKRRHVQEFKEKGLLYKIPKQRGKEAK